MKGTLTLIPTPIDDEGILDNIATDVLHKASRDPNAVIIVEELKPSRRRWLKWGLPREAIANFEQYNEHNRTESSSEFIKLLKSGKNLYLMSDGGLPAFCDPGRMLIDLCHREKIKVTSTPFYNSISLAIALSGFNHDRFMFEGFLPKDKDKRTQTFQTALDRNFLTVIMDTPYRLKQTLESLALVAGQKNKNRRIFLGIDLNSPTEELIRGSISNISKKGKELGKREFILLIDKK